MYRLCKFFVSEITAGENLLRHGFFPIFRENGKADHGVLFAANGTCKTTLLSFILNVFCPDQRRFVQHLQSGGDKTLEKYLIPGRPAVVLLDLITILPANLFEAEPTDHLVLGQLFYRHPSAPDKLDRIYFIAQSVDFFDLLRREWEALLSEKQPFKNVRDFMTPHIQQTTSQKEWTDTLERLGLDPWLLDRQIDFARTEGGIKDAFKFRSETEFLSFFLGCVADMQAAVILRESIDQSLRKIEERPRKREQLRATQRLKGQLADYEGIAAKWRKAHHTAQTWLTDLGEAVYMLQKADNAAKHKLEILTPALYEAENRRRNILKRLAVIKANRLAVLHAQLEKAITETEQKLRKEKDALTRLAAEKTAIDAADLIARIQMLRAQVENKQTALLQTNAEIAPMVRKVEALAAQYHLRLTTEKERFAAEIEACRAQSSTEQDRYASIAELNMEAKNQLNSLDEQAGRLSMQIRAAEEGHDALPMEPGESPAEAKERLTRQVDTIKDNLGQTTRHIEQIEEEIRANNSRWRQLQEKQFEAKNAAGQIRDRVAQEARQRASLLADPHLKRVAGAPDVEPTSAELVSRLDDAIARQKERQEDNQRRRLHLLNELERLKRTETLAVDDQTQQLIVHYHGAGIAAGALKSFPEYLADLHESAQDTADLIESDPARFTGIMAASKEVIAEVCALPAPPWLCRPVVISILSPSEEIDPIHETIIRPANPQVYSKHYLEETRTRLAQELELLNRELEEESANVRAMENSSRDLHAYRKGYPARTAVTALADRLKKQESAVDALNAEIETEEALTETLQQRKNDQTRHVHRLTADESRKTEWLHQVERWLRHYGNLESWRQEKEDNLSLRATLEKQIAANIDRLRQIDQTMAMLNEKIREHGRELKYLDDLAEEVPAPKDATLKPADRKAALAMDLKSLKKLYNAALENQRRTANVLGIDTLQKELDLLKGDLAEQESRLSGFAREHRYDKHLAQQWVTQTLSAREERRRNLGAKMEQLNLLKVQGEYEQNQHQKELNQLSAQLSQQAKKGIAPDLLQEDLADRDLDALLHRLQREAARGEADDERLEKRCAELTQKLKIEQQWQHHIQLGLAETSLFPPMWDQYSPRSQWPNLMDPTAERSELETIHAFRKQVKKIIDQQQAARQDTATIRQKMGNAFDRLRGDLQSDSYRHHLPAIIDELRQHDAESLAQQNRELIQRCDDVAGNIAGDLEISQKIVDNLVDMLLTRSREYHQKLQVAAQQILPKEVHVCGGKSILRAGTRLDFAKHKDVFRQSIENWLDELIQQERLPAVNPRAGNALGAELLYQLLGASSGKKEFGIRLLKYDDTGRNYEPVGKDLGSGGEALTIAVLLYALLISLRKKRRGRPDERLPAFLVLDNPLGVCNRSDFLDAQLRVAENMGLQCVYLTGINDRESLDLFELRIAIRKSGRKLEIDNVAYDCLEIIELNVENRNGPYLA
jgi:hypothetical protein